MRAVISTVVLLVLACCPTVAADKKIKPLAAQDCSAIAQSIGKAIGIPLSMKVGKPAFPDDVNGDACLLSGKATGLALDFIAAQDRIERSLTGWTRVPDYDADGPDGTMKGFTKAAQTIVYNLETEPPAGTCQDIVIADCKVPRRQWSWTLEVVAFLR
jgi:hypothetical protein